MEPQAALLAGFGFSILGFFLQTLNVSHGIRHAMKRPTPFNLILAACLILFAFSFIPLFFTSLFNFALTLAPVLALLDAVQVSNRVHNIFYAISTFMYLILIQIRFRVIKSILPYHNYWDYLFVIITIMVWSGTMFLFGVVAFGSVSPAQSLAFNALWTLYAIVVDNILSWLFLYHLFKCRSQVSNTERLKKLWKQSVYGLGILAGTTWIALILTAIATFHFSKDSMSRSLLYRAAYCFSPVQFSGSLLFIYTIRSLFDDKPSTEMHASSDETSLMSKQQRSTRQRESSSSGTLVGGNGSDEEGEIATGIAPSSPTSPVIYRMNYTPPISPDN